MKNIAKVLAGTLLFIMCSSTSLMAADTTYTVKTGDSLWKIAVTYKLTVDRLKQLNNLTSDLLFPGQVLLISSDIPANTENSKQDISFASETKEDSLVYTVKAGDTLWKIANEYGMTVKNLKRLNNLVSDSLNVGDILLVKAVNENQPDSSINPSRSGILADGNRVVEFASRYLGTPYRYGGNAPGGFDCSGFAQYVFNQFGYGLPRTAADQYKYGTYVERSELIPGDLVFFACYSKGIDHVGIYTGDGKFIHSSSPRSGGVIYSSLSENYYARSYVGAKRIIR